MQLTLLGVRVEPLSIEDLTGRITEAACGTLGTVFAHHNLHSVYLFHRDRKMRECYAAAEVTYIDGMALVYWARILGHPIPRSHRTSLLDWVGELMAEAARAGWCVYHLGGRPGVAEYAADRLRRRHPGLTLFTHHGYFPDRETAQILDEIGRIRPQLLLVGMGMPRQEHWVVENLEHLEAHAILLSGACFDYLAGAIPTPPRWMGWIGLEWLYRLATEPRRLWRRYLVEPWALLPLVIRDLRAKPAAGDVSDKTSLVD